MTAPLLPVGDFAAFFQAVHGVPPFPWQERLLAQLAENRQWPEVLDLPTGSGKTAALDIAIFHLALEASLGPDRRASLRIAFVVDRRLIVDDAYGRACKLQEALAAPKSDIVERVSAALRSLSGADEPPLLARRLRGGLPREDDWARTPCQPTILCSTVDQVGSRLLFRGYGVGDRMKPVHAGLLGSDCLILLDEAHLAEPFRQTLRGIANLSRKHAEAARWSVALLSATPGADDGMKDSTPRFSLDDADRADTTLARRLAAAKPAALIEITGRQGVSAELRRVEEIVEQTKAMLEKLRPTLRNPAIGVIVNRVARARRVFERLNGEIANAGFALIIGPSRPVEREAVAGQELRPIRTGEDRTLERPLIVVATQTIEAGVDIDFDGLVTEAAAFDALRQRFGRLNRNGRDIMPAAAIVAHKDDIGSRADDPVYGDRIRKTWDALTAVAAASAEETVDFGINRLPRQLTEQSDELATEKTNAPILLPAYVDLWSQTWPIPNADPEVSLFLHGADRSPASVQIVWRADISGGELTERDRLAALLDLVPPRIGEAVKVPLWAAQAWLRHDVAVQETLSDVTERIPPATSDRRGRPAFRYAGSEDERRTGAVYADQLRNGDLIVVPADYGGCDQWGWAPNSTETVTDLAEQAALLYGARRFTVRVTPELIQQGLAREAREQGDGTSGIEVAPPNLPGILAAHRDEAASVLLDAVLELRPFPKGMRIWLELLQHRKGRRLECEFPYGEDGSGQSRGIVFVAPRGIKDDKLKKRLGDATPEQGGAAATEDDWLGSTPGYPQSLEEHSCWVRDGAASFALNAGVKPEIAADIALAAYLHDAGKADPRFQAMLYGGNWVAVDDAAVLAKSATRGSRATWDRSGLPRRWRHEALSVRIAREHARFNEARDKELVLWLIGVHHGYGRPLFPHADEDPPAELPDVLGGLKAAAGPGPQSLAFEFAGWDWAQIFERLKRCYGVWELAKMEAIVRLADHRASEAADKRNSEDAR